jgi:AcrR family transcriptional regulator
MSDSSGAAAWPRLETVARPKQARSERTLHRILDAAEQLIEEQGLAGLSIPEIVRRARSSVGGFYARFRDKNELLRALEERFFQEQRRRVERLTRPEAWGPASLAQIVRACTGELVHVFRAREALIRAFVSRAVTDLAFRGEALRFRREVAERMGFLLASRSGEVGHPNPRRAVELGVAIAFGAMVARVLFGDAPGDFGDLSDEEAADELARNFLGYLSFDAPLIARTR